MARKTIENGLDKIKKNRHKYFFAFSIIGKKTPWIFGFQDITKQSWIFFFKKSYQSPARTVQYKAV